MLMCRSPFQGLLFIYTSQSQPPRCQPGLWRGTHSQGEGEERGPEDGGEEEEEEGTLGIRAGRVEMFLPCKKGREVKRCSDGNAWEEL